MSADTLARDFAAVLTDVNRMGYDSEDPMQHPKSRAQVAALQVLRAAVAHAQQLIDIADSVTRAHNNFKAEQAKKETP